MNDFESPENTIRYARDRFEVGRASAPGTPTHTGYMSEVQALAAIAQAEALVKLATLIEQNQHPQVAMPAGFGKSPGVDIPKNPEPEPVVLTKAEVFGVAKRDLKKKKVVVPYPDVDDIFSDDDDDPAA